MVAEVQAGVLQDRGAACMTSLFAKGGSCLVTFIVLAYPEYPILFPVLSLCAGPVRESTDPLRGGLRPPAPDRQHCVHNDRPVSEDAVGSRVPAAGSRVCDTQWLPGLP